MKQNKLKKSSVFLTTLLLSGALFSASLDKEALASECQFLGASLSQLAKANLKEYCTTDVDYSGSMLEQSAALIRSERMELARGNLDLANRTLARVASSYNDCPYFSSMTRPFTQKINHLIHELDSLNQHSSN
ncbi:TPA: hypothetical protein I8Y83_002796 [Legionella pneumophila]|uniref:Uncharacterized protein n=2 Tax=Legionella bozemanae TaxID=447 RepID=A0A0W0RBK4_LEGBO|nr:hypothetical protein [Legionella bozemanae]KTC68396.1 hypothetical protein Lboz_3381 [Legionella bozemanae]STP10127.1 Uncharacterised protein [Legionella bozemanae]HAT1722241.1 hypothetical protein [Legionella pneumophila]